jgi:polysaccharide deacetylase 2 family uncharacterized protein YibQ
VANQTTKKSTSQGAKKGRRKSPSKKSRYHSLIVGGVIFALGCLVLALWVGRDRQYEKITIPPYEEQIGNRFGELVNEVELKIYQSLRQLGVDAAQIRFRKVIHRAQPTKKWDFTELEVTLTLDESVPKFEQLLSKNLKDLGGQVSLERVKTTDPNPVFLIRVEGVMTHRLTLVRHPAGKGARADVPRVAIVIDDFGYDGGLARRFLQIDAPLSFSVLPNGTFSKSIARRVRQSGRELLLHLPMEPKGYPEVDPGMGALLTEMTDMELMAALRKNLDSLPHIKGVNNHMGSEFCEHEEKLKVVMRELKNRGLFFVDSRTTSRTQAYRVAQEEEVPSAERNVFLDNIQNPQAVRRQLKRLIQLAKLKGEAIGIAHPHEVTLKVLKEDIPKLSGNGIELVPVSQLVR